MGSTAMKFEPEDLHRQTARVLVTAMETTPIQDSRVLTKLGESLG
jgi:hypothetical protein